MNKYDFLALNNITYFKNKEKYKDFLISTQKKLKENEFRYAFYDRSDSISNNYEEFDTLTKITKDYLVHHYLSPYENDLTVFIEKKDKLYHVNKEYHTIKSISVFDYNNDDLYKFIKNIHDKRKLFSFHQSLPTFFRTYSTECFVLYHTDKEKFNSFFTKSNNNKIDKFNFINNEISISFDRSFYDKAVFNTSGFFSQWDFHPRIKKNLSLNTIINKDNTITSFEDFYNYISENLELYKLTTDKHYKLAITKKIFDFQNSYLKEISKQKNNLLQLRNNYIEFDVYLEKHQNVKSTYNSSNNIRVYNDEFTYEENYKTINFHNIKDNSAFESIKGLEQLLCNVNIEMDLDSKRQLESLINAMAKTFPNQFLNKLTQHIDQILELSVEIEKNILKKTTTKKALSL